MKPAEGEWWMCKAKHTLRITPMFKTKNGWCSLLNAEGKPLKQFTTDGSGFYPIYKMIEDKQ